MKDSTIFDIKRISEKFNISNEDLKALEKTIRKEFSGDEMMYELHLIRALKSLRKSKNLKVAVN